MTIIILLLLALFILFIVGLFGALKKICSNPEFMLASAQREYNLFKELTYNYPTDRLHKLVMLINMAQTAAPDPQTKSMLLAMLDEVCQEINRRDYFDAQKKKF